MISRILIIATDASSGQKGSRVGIVAISLQLIRGRAWELLLRTVISMFQGRRRRCEQFLSAGWLREYGGVPNTSAPVLLAPFLFFINYLTPDEI